MIGRPRGSGGQRSRSQEAAVMFGSLVETSILDPLTALSRVDSYTVS